MKIDEIILRPTENDKNGTRWATLIIRGMGDQRVEVRIEEFFEFINEDFSYLEKYRYVARNKKDI